MEVKLACVTRAIGRKRSSAGVRWVQISSDGEAARVPKMIFDSAEAAGHGRVVALDELRKEYTLAGLAEKDLARDPFRQFEKWFQEAEASKLVEPNAMVVSTVGSDGRPSARTMLLKGLDGRGFVFFSNFQSRKGRELEGNPNATLVFPWFPFERQVIVEGSVAKVAREEAEAYFHSRPRPSQLSAWVSVQSAIIPGRAVLEDSLKALEQKYAGKEIPLPPHWGGWRLAPASVEFWQGRRSRLHDRLRYRRVGTEWVIERLSP